MSEKRSWRMGQKEYISGKEPLSKSAEAEALRGATKLLFIITEAIREAKQIPSGHLYAMLMPYGCTLSTYEAIIGVVVRSGVVEKSGDMLIWKGATAE